MLDFAVAVAWVSEKQRDAFMTAWGLTSVPSWLFLEQDKDRSGGAVTKNRAARRAARAGAEIVVSLDDDCFPHHAGTSLPTLAEAHSIALAAQPVQMYRAVTAPPSRGTPYVERSIEMPVACSMGFWSHVGDYCAARQLAYGPTHPMTFDRSTVFGRYFSLCGMNIAFRPREWDPWCYLVEGVGRFDDIWMGWLWQKEAYRRGHCFNLNGPLVRHSRQSNVWRNLRDEARDLEANETLWKAIAMSRHSKYEDLRGLLPRRD